MKSLKQSLNLKQADSRHVSTRWDNDSMLYWILDASNLFSEQEHTFFLQIIFSFYKYLLNNDHLSYLCNHLQLSKKEKIETWWSPMPHLGCLKLENWTSNSDNEVTQKSAKWGLRECTAPYLLLWISKNWKFYSQYRFPNSNLHSNQLSRHRYCNFSFINHLEFHKFENLIQNSGFLSKNILQDQNFATCATWAYGKMRMPFSAKNFFPLISWDTTWSHYYHSQA